MTWQLLAACKESKNPSAWFSNDWNTQQRAIRTCNECPVRKACLEYAMQRRENYGIWGGLLPAAQAKEGRMRFPCVQDGCEVGASKDGFCAAHYPDAYLARSLPAGPLVALVEARGGPAACGALPGDALSRGYHRVKERGVLGPIRADRLSHELLGCHPCEVWAEWFGPFGVSV